MMSFIQSNVALALVGVAMVSLWQPIASHGRLWTPPARGSMFRRGYNTPADYDDTAGYCGGVQVQIKNGYKCGICGDPVTGPLPHEAGGPYATNTTTGTYTQGETITIQVELTANHKGWFEFKLCPVNDYRVKATQDCLDQHVLQLTQFPGTTKLDVSKTGTRMVDIEVRLPTDLTCTFCTLQWRYHTGNSWGVDSDGRGCIGCGMQEEFYGCADVAIRPNGSPSGSPSGSPTGSPSGPSAVPTSGPSVVPTSGPSVVPTSGSSSGPLIVPTSGPSVVPTSGPSVVPTSGPSVVPTSGPSVVPTSGPSVVPNSGPSVVPNSGPSVVPTSGPSTDPRFQSMTEPGCYATTSFFIIPGADGWCKAVCHLGFCPKNKCFCVEGRN